MPNDFNYGTDVLGTSNTEVYTCPSSTVAIVIGISCANIHATDQQLLTIVRECADLGVTRTVVKEVPVAANGGFSPMENIGKMVLKAGDKILGKCGVANQIEMFVDVLEIS